MTREVDRESAPVMAISDTPMLPGWHLDPLLTAVDDANRRAHLDYLWMDIAVEHATDRAIAANLERMRPK